MKPTPTTYYFKYPGEGDLGSAYVSAHTKRAAYRWYFDRYLQGAYGTSADWFEGDAETQYPMCTVTSEEPEVELSSTGYAPWEKQPRPKWVQLGKKRGS